MKGGMLGDLICLLPSPLFGKVRMLRTVERKKARKGQEGKEHKDKRIWENR
jgi:hypothetical protein